MCYVPQGKLGNLEDRFDTVILTNDLILIKCCNHSITCDNDIDWLTDWLRSLLGLDGAAERFLSGMSVAELTKLIYRDHIPMKHASRKRLSDEISTIENSRACERPLQRPALEEASADTGTDLLSQLLVKYLMQVSVFIKTSSVPARSNNFVQDWAGLTFQQLDNNNQQVFQVFLVFFLWL